MDRHVKKWMGVVFFGVAALCFVMASCAPGCPQDYLQEGQSVERAIIKELKKIQNREQLVKAQGRLTKQFDKLASIMIQARSWYDSHPLGEEDPLTKKDLQLSETLRQQLARIYAIDGGRALIESCQQGAVNSLDLFEQRRARRQVASLPR